MPVYSFQCRSRASGEEYPISVEADSLAAATEQALREGHQILRQLRGAVPAAAGRVGADAVLHDDLARIRDDLAAIRGSWLLARPFLVVAVGLVVGHVLLLIIGVAVAVVLWDLGVVRS